MPFNIVRHFSSSSVLKRACLDWNVVARNHFLVCVVVQFPRLPMLEIYNIHQMACVCVRVCVCVPTYIWRGSFVVVYLICRPPVRWLAETLVDNDPLHHPPTTPPPLRPCSLTTMADTSRVDKLTQTVESLIISDSEYPLLQPTIGNNSHAGNEQIYKATWPAFPRHLVILWSPLHNPRTVVHYGNKQHDWHKRWQAHSSQVFERMLSREKKNMAFMVFVLQNRHVHLSVKPVVSRMLLVYCNSLRRMIPSKYKPYVCLVMHASITVCRGREGWINMMCLIA